MCLTLLFVVKWWLNWYSFCEFGALEFEKNSKTITDTIPDPIVCDELDSILVHVWPVFLPKVYRIHISDDYTIPQDPYTLKTLFHLVVVDLILCIASKVFKLTSSKV